MSNDTPEDELTVNKRRARRIDLGLAISGALLRPGETRTLREIAMFCDVSHQAIDQIERKAMAKFKQGLAERGYTQFTDLLPKTHD